MEVKRSFENEAVRWESTEKRTTRGLHALQMREVWQGTGRAEADLNFSANRRPSSGPAVRNRIDGSLQRIRRSAGSR